MGIGDRVPDRQVLQNVNKKLRQAGSQSKVSASVRGGCVTLTGALQYENQRRQIVRKMHQVTGVRQVIDQMTVPARKREKWPSGPADAGRSASARTTPDGPAAKEEIARSSDGSGGAEDSDGSAAAGESPDESVSDRED